MFTFYLANQKTPLTNKSAKWQDHLPMDRHQRQNHTSIPFRYGDYFTAARKFLENNHFEMPVNAVSAFLRRRITQNDIKAIHIHLEKHGEFYHPASVRVTLDGGYVTFVLNVAVSESGLNLMGKEYGILDKLDPLFSTSFIPKVYGMGNVVLDNGICVKMFLGEWFDDFHEFHVTDQYDDKKGIVAWDPVRGRVPLTFDQMEDLYRQTAYILTTYYNPETFEQVYPWHHAAGDFIVRLDENKRVDLRLITVRDYQPLVENAVAGPNDLQSIMDAMLFFFLNLSIRTRLDRMDGVNNITWSNDIAVKATIDGFFEALSKKPAIANIPVPLTECFMVYFVNHTTDDILDLSHEIMDAYHPSAPELSVIRENLEKHISDIRKYCFQDD